MRPWALGWATDGAGKATDGGAGSGYADRPGCKWQLTSDFTKLPTSRSQYRGQTAGQLGSLPIIFRGPDPSAGSWNTRRSPVTGPLTVELATGRL